MNNCFTKVIIFLNILQYHGTAFSPVLSTNFSVSVIHLNDFHARFEEVNSNSVTCLDEEMHCIGGIARVHTAVTRILEEQPSSLFLNAGDNFQGTLWYNIFKWNVTQQFLNKLPTDAYTLGNHDFDDAIAGVVPFIQHLNAPVVVANIDASEEPDILGLFNKSVIVIKNGVRIGIIGVILESTPSMATTENLKFLPESASVNEEADRLVSENLVDTIIVVSHCGYQRDIAIARNATLKIGLIVGGHSHTLLYNGPNSPSGDIPAGDYPTVVTQLNGRQILVVQASAYTRYLGNITVFYDSDGNVVEWEGAPILLDYNIEKNATIEEELRPWKEVVDSYGSTIVGETAINLTRGCYNSECIMGDVIADAMAASYKGTSSSLQKYPALGFINAGGVRAALAAGNISYANAAEVVPFGNTCDYGELNGRYLLEALRQTENDTLLQISSGLRLNYTRSPRTLHSVEVYCTGCETPGFVPLNEEDDYVVVFPSFFVSVGRWNALYTNVRGYTIGEVDLTALADYFTAVNPIRRVQTGRINFVTIQEDDPVTSPDDNGSAARIFSPQSSLIIIILFMVSLYADIQI